MATNENTGDAGQAAALPEVPAAPTKTTAGPLFEPFRWVRHGDFSEELPVRQLIDLTNRVRSLAGGLEVILGMLEREEIDEGSYDERDNPLPKLFSVADRGDLMRMSVAVCGALRDISDDAVSFIDDARDHRARQGAR